MDVFNPDGSLALTVPASSSHDDFDFLIGHWDVHNRALKSRLTGSDEWKEFEFTNETRFILSGFGNVDESGSTMRRFDPATNLWTIFSAYPGATGVDQMQGFFEDGVGHFYSREILEGKAVITQFEWDGTDPERPIWRQALSADDGVTWEWNWTMTFTRRSDCAESFLSVPTPP
jgi:hypothetical protein